MKRRTILKAALGAGLAATLPSSFAQAWPNRPVRLVNPFPPGGPLDVLGRVLSEPLSKAFGQTFLVEAKPGAAGNIGAESVAKADPDGYTLLLGLFSIMATNPHLYSNLRFDPLKDFVPVAAIASYDAVLIVHPSVPANTVAELLAYAKANPGKINYASAGRASPGHVVTEYFRLKTGINVVHVPYKGNAPAVQSVVAGETQMMMTPTTGAIPHVKAGRLKALAVFLEDRVDALPGVPSLESLGIKGFDQKSLPSWYGLFAPAGTPAEIVNRLSAETIKALGDPKVKERMAAGRYDIIAGGPDVLTAMLKDSHAAWGRVIRETGIRAE